MKFATKISPLLNLLKVIKVEMLLFLVIMENKLHFIDSGNIIKNVKDPKDLKGFQGAPQSLGWVTLIYALKSRC